MGGMGWQLGRGRALLAAVLVAVGGVALAEPAPLAGPEVAAAEAASTDVAAAEVASPEAAGADTGASEPPVALAAVVSESPPARGQESVSEEGEPAVARKEKVRVFGRVFARASADERADFARQFDIPSARVGVRATFDFVEAEVTADLASRNNLLKDAFVRLADDAKRLRLYGGHFKAPFLARELESSWELPLLERGLVADYLTETNQLGGRRMGVMGEVRLKGLAGLRAALGVFEGAEDDLGLRRDEDASARLSVQPLEALTVGASTYVTEVVSGARHWASAADATLRVAGLRLSGELTTGRVAAGRFDAQLALVTASLALGRQGWALEPVMGVEALQLKGPGSTGRGHGLVGGLNLLLADRFKAQLQLERALRPGDERPGVELALQLATRFF